MALPDLREHKRLTLLLQRYREPRSGRRRRSCFIYRIHVYPDHEAPPIEHGIKRLAPASPFDPVRGIGLRVDDPEVRDPSW